ncbi:hypothetical protein [Brevundimonas sp.]|uniref:hypothetical protein n=1 Tax=Brevundimonas sp. TaxID=1871086 RepID=UPI00273069BE|nr:hypothetical protein [Brevundimonas sp.]MDP1914126.1 hypothetical protein [Brevundimonas sp.]
MTVGAFHGGIKHNIISDRIDPQPSVVTGVEAMVVAAQALMPKGCGAAEPFPAPSVSPCEPEAVMPIPKLATLIGGLLLSKGGRRMAGRHAGKLALATLAFQLWEQRHGAKPPPGPPAGATHPRRRWSGRRV